MNLKSRITLLLMDFEPDVIAMLEATGSREALQKARRALEAARAAAVSVIFVTVSYRPVHIDASRRNKRVSMLRERGMFTAGSIGTKVAIELAPRPDEARVVKRRVSALAHTDLPALLSALDIETLALCGLSTNGVVLSTVRQAADADFQLIVL